MKITNKLSLPYGLVKAVSPEPHNKPGEISATTLIQGTKQVILTQCYWDKLEDDVSERIWAVFGTAVHALLENEGEEDYEEYEDDEEEFVDYTKMTLEEQANYEA